VRRFMCFSLPNKLHRVRAACRARKQRSFFRLGSLDGRRSKADKHGAGRKIGIPDGSNPETCPVRYLQAWIEQAGIISGPLFRSINRNGHIQPARLSGIDVARIVKKLAIRAGLDAAKYAGHSLRAGHATSAAIAGASERSIMNQTGHRSVQMVRRYIRDGSLFRENSAAKLGL
jgi:integrase-like protein